MFKRFLRRKREQNVAWYQGPLVSWEYGITGKPDYLVDHNGYAIPIMVKTGPAPDSPHDSHVAQILVYCLLVHETTQVPPPYGIIRYADRAFEVDYTESAAETLISAIEEMHTQRQFKSLPPRSHDVARRCFACRHRKRCRERLT